MSYSEADKNLLLGTVMTFLDSSLNNLNMNLVHGVEIRIFGKNFEKDPVGRYSLHKFTIENVDDMDYRCKI